MKQKITIYRIFDKRYEFYIRAGYRNKNKWFTKPTEIWNKLDKDIYELHKFHGELHGFNKVK